VSIVAIIPAAQMAAANAALAALGRGERNFTVAAFTGARANWAGLHARGDPVFATQIKVQPGVIYDESEGDPRDRIRALIEAQGARWGDDAPRLPDEGVIMPGDLYRVGFELWWVIQQHDRGVFGGDPAQYPALIRRARIPGEAAPWVQPIDQFDAYRVLDPFTGAPEEVTHEGKVWRASQGDGAGLVTGVPGVAGWIEIDGPGGEPVAPPVGEWAPGQVVAVNDLRTYQGLTYRCQIAHTTQVGWHPPAVPALWILVT